MDVTAYFLNVTVHVLAALFWLGGIFFLAVVGAPVLRTVEPPALRAELFRRLGRQFRVAGWTALLILVATGVGNLYFRGVLSWRVLGSARFWSTPFGVALAWKLGCVAVMLGAQAVHDFVIGPASSRVPAGTEAARRLRRQAAWTARINVVVGLVLVIAAVRLARGG